MCPSLCFYFAHQFILFIRFHINEIIWCLSYSDRLISLSIFTPIPSTLSQKLRFPSFLQLSNIPLCKCTTAFFIHSSADGHLDCFQVLAIVNNVAMNIQLHMFFWISVSSFFNYIPEVEWQDPTRVPFLIFWRKLHTVFTVAASACIPTNSALGVSFSPHPHQHLLFVHLVWWPFWLVWNDTSLWF